MGLFGPSPVLSGLATSRAYGLLATAPPLPAPGRSFLDTLAWMQVFGNPLDTFFFHSWPDEINEGITTQWEPLDFSGAPAPLAFVYRGNQWDPFQVKLQLHSSNPALPQNLRGGTPQGAQAVNIGFGLVDLLRIQLQVAWCKSICLPNTDIMERFAQQTLQKLFSASDFSEVLSASVDALTGAAEVAGIFAEQLFSGGIYSGEIFPPLIYTQYGSFLAMYGFCDSLQIRWLPPFLPLAAFPMRAEVSLNFKRFFPFSLPNRTRARAMLGDMS